MNTNMWISRISEMALASWEVAGAMAPYLLFGFLIAGLLSVWLSPAWVRRHLGGSGWKSSARAALLGVPLPVCSCGVIPLAASLRRQGASRGATVAFLMSTPQTGVDSMLVTWGMLGPVIAIFRPLAAFISGAICGILVDFWNPSVPVPLPDETGGADADRPEAPRPWWFRALRHGFVVLPRDVHNAVLVGLLVSGLMGALLPPASLGDFIGHGVGAMGLMLLVGIPLYVCSTASVPIAVALIHAGVSPGAALVFLISGPASNAATLAALYHLLGSRATALYLVTLASTAMLSGWTLDRLLLNLPEGNAVCHPLLFASGGWHTVSAIVLLIVLVAPMVRRRVRA